MRVRGLALGLFSLTGCLGAEREAAPRWLEAAGMRATLSPSGLTLARRGDVIELRLASLRRAGRLAPLTAPRALPPRDGRLRLDRGAGVEEWLTLAQGQLEHGLTLERRPLGSGALAIDLEVVGATPRLSDSAVTLTTVEGELRYGGLATRDAEGHHVPSRLAVAGSHIRLEVDDRGARYPLVVDPTFWVEGAELGPPTPDTPALALSGDTLVIGRPETPEHGEISNVDRSGFVWSETTFMPAPAPWEQRFGQRVALENDWLAVASGPPAAVDLYHGPDVVWHFAGHLDLATGIRAVALHAGTVAIGLGGSVAFAEDTGAGWSVTQVFSPAQPSMGFGEALAFDGDRLLVGAVDDASLLGVPSGAVLTLERIAGVWTQTQITTPSDAAALDGFGLSLAVDGDRMVVGAGLVGQTLGRCAVYVFERSGGGPWVETTRLTGVDPSASDGFGAAVALRGDTIVVGAPDAGGLTSNGAVHTFERTAGAWVPAPVLAPQLAEKAHFGAQVALTNEQLFVADWLATTHVFNAVGRSCSDALGCPTGYCADGRCCDAACSASCEACSVAAREGLCTVILGEPTATHPPCAPASCVDGLAVAAGSCQGEASCTEGGATPCAPYACGEDRCLDVCDDDEACAPGYACDPASRTCVAATAVCDGDHTLLAPGGASTDCAPFRCAADRCVQPCTSSGACVEGYVCASDGRCVAQSDVTAADGCACAAAGGPGGGLPAMALGAGCAIAIAGRRRRRFR